MSIPYLYLKDYKVDSESGKVALGGNFFKDSIPLGRDDV